MFEIFVMETINNRKLIHSEKIKIEQNSFHIVYLIGMHYDLFGI